VKTKWRLCFLG